MKKRQCRVKIPASDREKSRKSAKMSTAGSKKKQAERVPETVFLTQKIQHSKEFLR